MKMVKVQRESKKPCGAHWIVSDDPEVIDLWISQGFNVGLLTGEPNGIVVFDFDGGKERARRFYEQNKEIIRTIVETRNGIHLYFKGEGPGCKTPWGDFKANGGYVLYPPSIVKSEEGLWTYGFVNGHEFTEDLYPYPESYVKVALAQKVTRKEVKRLDAYLATVESIQGQHGSNGLVRAAALCRDNGLSEAEATVKLLWWNTLPVVQPAWSAEQIARAVTRTYRKERVV